MISTILRPSGIGPVPTSLVASTLRLATQRPVAKAVALVRRRRPQVIVSVGGFASAPCVFAAWVWRVPLVVAEQNSVPDLKKKRENAKCQK